MKPSGKCLTLEPNLVTLSRRIESLPKELDYNNLIYFEDNIKEDDDPIEFYAKNDNLFDDSLEPIDI